MPNNPPTHLDIDETSAGQRIDNFLLRKLKGVPKSHIYLLLRTGQVRVNKKRIKPNYHLEPGDIVRIPPLRISAELKPTKPSPKLLQLLKQSIIYEDQDLLVINKPYGIASHGGSGINFGAIEILRDLNPDLKYLELAHRLDRDTSGCLLLVKKRSILAELHELWRAGKVTKIYLALIKGKLPKPSMTIEMPLLKNRLLSGERMVLVDEEQGKLAVTKLIQKKNFDGYSLVEIGLDTGRTHQIRVHAKHLGCPIVGDDKYGDKAFNQTMRKKAFNRLFLHAHKLEFYLSSKSKAYRFVAPVEWA